MRPSYLFSARYTIACCLYRSERKFGKTKRQALRLALQAFIPA